MARRRVSEFDALNRPPPAPAPASLQFPRARAPGGARRDATANLLLATLPDEEFARLSTTLEAVTLKLKALIYRPGDPIRHVFFPGGGFCSELAVLEDGAMVEVATIGREGVAGVLHATTGQLAPSALMVQGEMPLCYRMKADAFRGELDRGGAFSRSVAAYSHVLTSLLMQSTACNAVHGVEQRLARWLLRAHDHMGTDSFRLTQEFVAMMLGVARPSVAVVAGKLQKAGLITYHRGLLRIVDREQLEAAACECYRTTANLVRSLAH